MLGSSSSSLRGKSLRDFVNGSSNALASVILEVRRAPVSSSVVAANKRLHATAPPAIRKARPVELKGPRQEHMRAVQHVLKQLGLDAKARRLDASGCFVVEVSPSQLLVLADLLSIQAIRPNQLRRWLA